VGRGRDLYISVEALSTTEPPKYIWWPSIRGCWARWIDKKERKSSWVQLKTFPTNVGLPEKDTANKWLHFWQVNRCLRRSDISKSPQLLTLQLTTGSPTGTVTQSCRHSPGDICRRLQQSYLANESGALRETYWPTTEIAYHQSQTMLKNSSSWKKTCWNFEQPYICLFDRLIVLPCSTFTLKRI